MSERGIPSQHLVDGHEPVEEQPKPALRILSRAELDSIPPPEWLIDGMVTTGLTVLYGPSGAGKSFVALDWSLAVATGRPWFGHKVSRRPVLYVAAEGTSGIPRRVKAWEEDRRSRAHNFMLVPQVVNLLSIPDVDRLSDAVDSTAAGVLVIDTLARSMPGGDENAAQDMGSLVHALTAIQQRHGCAVVLVHHTGVEGTRPRGSTALFGAMDTVVKLIRGENKLLMSCEKQKDDDPFALWALRMKPVLDSVVLTPFGGASTTDRKSQVLNALASGPKSYVQVAQAAGGDTELLARLELEHRVVTFQSNGHVLYRLPAEGEVIEEALL